MVAPRLLVERRTCASRMSAAETGTRPGRRVEAGRQGPFRPVVSSAFWKRPAWLFSALARVSNQSAISSKPSSRAVRAMPGYMSVYSWVSPAIAALRLSPVAPIGWPVAGSPTLLEELEVAVRVAGLALGGRAEHGGDVVVALDVGLLREIEIAAVGLALAGERCLQVVFGLGSFELGHGASPENYRWILGSRGNDVK